MRNIPIITFINKMDRDAKNSFDLLEDIENVLGIHTYPVNWPIGSGKEFKGVYDRNSKKILAFTANNGQKEVEKKELIRAINSFLDTLSQEKCNIFLCRYWYAIPVSEIATRFGMSEGNVSVTLTRIRIKLKNYLKERGYDL